MVDNDLQFKLIEYNKLRLFCFKNDCYIYDNKRRIIGFDLCNKVVHVNKEYERILHARIMKNNRIQKHIVYGLVNYKYAYFGTFTFSDDNIDKCERTQRDAIKKCLKSLNIQYILNKDYGDQTNRLHYHCILFCDYPIEEITTPQRIMHKNHFKTIWTNIPCYDLGLTSFEPIGRDKNDIMALKKYINKLANHCQKDSVNNSRVVYSFKAYEKDYFSIYYDNDDPHYTQQQKDHFNSLRNSIKYFEDKELLGFETCSDLEFPEDPDDLDQDTLQA